jgi:hypothetical protein
MQIFACLSALYISPKAPNHTLLMWSVHASPTVPNKALHCAHWLCDHHTQHWTKFHAMISDTALITHNTQSNVRPSVLTRKNIMLSPTAPNKTFNCVTSTQFTQQRIRFCFVVSDSGLLTQSIKSDSTSMLWLVTLHPIHTQPNFRLYSLVGDSAPVTQHQIRFFLAQWKIPKKRCTVKMVTQCRICQKLATFNLNFWHDAKLS